MDRPHESKFKLTVPSTPQKILFKGIDLEVNGKKELAMAMYLYGAARLSGGCESNVQRMLMEAGVAEFSTIRGRMAKICPDECMVAYDYLCATIDADYNIAYIREAAENNSSLAMYCLIRLQVVEGEDPMIDAFYTKVYEDESKVEEGMKLLVRKKNSAKAEGYLANLKERRRLRQTIRPAFLRAMKGDEDSMDELLKLSETFPEAGFLKEYVTSNDKKAHIRSGIPEFIDTILSVSSELGIANVPFGRYLVAKKMQLAGDEWILAMIQAAAAGSPEAVEELRPVQSRRDVSRALSEAYLARGDVEGLVKCYDGKNSKYLERYCRNEPVRIIEVSRMLRATRSIDWLKKRYLDGILECRDELISLSSSERHRGKQLIYTLHDVGADLEAAKLYTDMYGDPSLPSVKWLRKVCENEEAKDFLRTSFEERNDTTTFESIFRDDDYERKRRNRSKGERQSNKRR